MHHLKLWLCEAEAQTLTYMHSHTSSNGTGTWSGPPILEYCHANDVQQLSEWDLCTQCTTAGSLFHSWETSWQRHSIMKYVWIHKSDRIQPTRHLELIKSVSLCEMCFHYAFSRIFWFAHVTRKQNKTQHMRIIGCLMHWGQSVFLAICPFHPHSLGTVCDLKEDIWTNLISVAVFLFPDLINTARSLIPDRAIIPNRNRCICNVTHLQFIEMFKTSVHDVSSRFSNCHSLFSLQGRKNRGIEWRPATGKMVAVKSVCVSGTQPLIATITFLFN